MLLAVAAWVHTNLGRIRIAVVAPGIASSNGAAPWAHAGEDAEWRDTMMTHEDYLASPFFGKPVPSIFKISTMRLEFVMADVLHVVDQGVAVHIIANTMVEVMKLGHWGGNQESQLAGLQALTNYHTPQALTFLTPNASVRRP